MASSINVHSFVLSLSLLPSLFFSPLAPPFPSFSPLSFSYLLSLSRSLALVLSDRSTCISICLSTTVSEVDRWDRLRVCTTYFLWSCVKEQSFITHAGRRLSWMLKLHQFCPHRRKTVAMQIDLSVFKTRPLRLHEISLEAVLAKPFLK